MKKIFTLLIGLLLFVVVAIAGVFTFINPNDFKPMLVNEVKKATGQELVIDGDIQWRFWPSLGLSIDKLAVRNPKGFSEPNMLRLESVEMSVAVMPLLSNTLDIGVIKLYGANVFIQTLDNGSSNLDGFLNTSVKQESLSSETMPSSSVDKNPTDSEKAEKKAWVISIGGLDVLNASATILDDKTGTINQISRLNVNMGQLEINRWVPLTFDLNGKQNELTFELKGHVEALLSKNIKDFQFRQLGLVARLDSENMKLDSADLTIDKIQIGTPSALNLALKGKTKDLSFDAKVDFSVLVDESMTFIDATKINGLALLSGKGLPKQSMSLGFKGDASIDMQKQDVLLTSLSVNADELILTGSASLKLADIPAIRFDLYSDKIDLDTFFGPQTALKASSSATSNSNQNNKQKTVSPEIKPLSTVEPDLSVLNTVDFAGKMSIKQFIASNMLVTDVIADVEINRGKVNVRQFDAQLYGGTINVTASLDASVSPARYSLNKGIKGVNVQHLLIAAAGQDILSATGNIQANLRGVGLSDKALRTGIAGTVAINFADGALAGINIPEIIREAKAILKGKRAEYVKETKKTDFTALMATFTLADGNAITQNMILEAPAIRVQGSGVTNLVNQTMKFEILTSVVASSKGQGGKDISELKDLTIPVEIGGTWQVPSYKLNLKGLFSRNKELETKVRNEAERGLKKLLGDNADDANIKQVADKLLKSLFN